MALFEGVVEFVKWLYQAALVYASTEEGSASLTAILDQLEAEGIDIPFYEPKEQQATTDTTGSGQPSASELISDRAAAARQARHAAREANRK